MRVAFWQPGCRMPTGNVREALHGEMARFLTVAWSINALLVSAFLLLAHLQPLGHGLSF